MSMMFAFTAVTYVPDREVAPPRAPMARPGGADRRSRLNSPCRLLPIAYIGESIGRRPPGPIRATHGDAGPQLPDLRSEVAGARHEVSRRNSATSLRMGMSARLFQASFMNLRSSVFTFVAHRFGVKSLCSYARCGMMDAKLFAVTLHPLALIAACGARWNRASRAWQYPCCSLSALQSRGDGGPTAGARPRGEPLCERRMEESASPT